MPEINADRLLADLRTLRKFGSHGTGVIRRALSPVDMESRRWLMERMKEAGLDPVMDGLGTVLGRSRAPGKALLVGSHSDTQPTGGWLDGAMGVIYGLEVARALSESDSTRDFAVDVASWIDEEGNFQIGCMGSKVYCGRVSTDTLCDNVNDEGERFADIVKRLGIAGRPLFLFEPGHYEGYVEAHIEQGPYLEDENKRIGVVTSIVGIRNLHVRFHGQQNHAGTTPMPRRKDAASALFELAHTVNTEFPNRVGPKTVWTIGEVSVLPGADSIVPGEASMTLQFRDGEESKLDELDAFVRELAAQANATSPVEITVEGTGNFNRAAVMDEEFRSHIAKAAERHAPGEWMYMPSAAGHDAQVLATKMPCAMLFVPSIGGISHAFEEDTSDEDLVLGCQVLATAIASILAERSQAAEAGDGNAGNEPMEKVTRPSA